jgi:curved DNA-binding protein CbpA
VEFWGHVDALVDRLSSVNYFELLGVAPDAKPLAIRDAYYQALRRYHPDRYVARERAAERQRKLALICARIGEAYRTLSNPTRRAAYLEALAAGETRTRPGRRRGLTDSRDPRTDKGRSLLASARDLAARGNRAGARAKLELALQFEPESVALAAALAEVEGEVSEGGVRQP